MAAVLVHLQRRVSAVAEVDGLTAALDKAAAARQADETESSEVPIPETIFKVSTSYFIYTKSFVYFSFGVISMICCLQIGQKLF